MSLSAEIRNTAYGLFDAEGACTLDKIKEELNNRGIQMEGNNAAIRAAMSQLVRKDKNVKRTGRGCFEYIRNEETRNEGFHVEEKIAEVQDDDMIEMDKLEKQALEIIREAGEFDWINRSDEEVDRIRKKVKRVKKLIKTLQKECMDYHISLN